MTTATYEAQSPAVQAFTQRPQTQEVSSLWDEFDLTLLIDQLVAGIPASEKTMDAWLDKHNVSAEERAAQKAMLEREEVKELHGTIFFRDPNGVPSFEGRCVKAAFKEAANVLKEMMDKKAYRAKLAERLFVGPKWVPLNAEIKSGYRPISVFTAQGPRTSLKTFEYAENVSMKFRVRVLRDSVLKEGDLRMLVEYMAENGVGSDRSQGAGQVLEWSFERVS